MWLDVDAASWQWLVTICLSLFSFGLFRLLVCSVKGKADHVSNLKAENAMKEKLTTL